MKIISKYHDYYDNVRAYGTDSSVMYIRKKQMFNKGSQEYKLAYKTLKLDELFHVRLYSDFISNYWIISFCGKIFPIIEYYFGSFKQICHTLETAHKVIKKYSKKEQYNVWESNSYRSSASLRRHSVRIFEHTALNTEELHHYFKAPVFMYDRHENQIITNPELGKVEFYKHMNAFTAYQELSQYVGGILSNTSQPPEKISDEDKKIMHGFDKWSFKTMPK